MRILTVFFLVILFLPSQAAAENNGKTKSASTGNPIQDNSFLVEEAYNQENGVIQHISFVQRLSSGDLVYSQTDEWPLRSVKHQLSITAGLARSSAFPRAGSGWSDTAFNYRYQLIGDGEKHIAVAPRLSVLAPTGNSTVGRGYGGWGLQANLPVSITHGRHVVTHWNAGLTWIPVAKDSVHDEAQVVNPNLGQSTVLLINPRFNALCEGVWSSNAAVTGPAQTTRSQTLYVSPGVRWAYNFANGLQIVPGIGVPIGVGPSSGQTGLIFYLSFEHGFRLAKSK